MIPADAVVYAYGSPAEGMAELGGARDVIVRAVVAPAPVLTSLAPAPRSPANNDKTRGGGLTVNVPTSAQPILLGAPAPIVPAPAPPYTAPKVAPAPLAIVKTAAEISTADSAAAPAARFSLLWLVLILVLVVAGVFAWRSR